MMMNSYLQQRKKNTRGKLTSSFKIIFLFAVFIIAIRIIFPNTFSDSLHFISTPLWSVKNTVATEISSLSALLRSKKSLVEENRILRTQLEDRNADILTLELLREENTALKEVMGRSVQEETILAAILVRPNVSPYDTFVIDIGVESGVEEGNNVIASDNIIIGVVDNVYRKSSVVKLFSAPGEKTTVSVGPQNILAEAVGRGGGNFFVRIPRGVDIEENYIITMPGINQKIFGIVEEIEANPTDPFQTILFKNPVNISEVKWVQIITSD